MTHRLLVVDDDADLREVLTLTLLSAGWQVMAETGGEPAIKRCSAGEADAVLLDLEMPGMDGRATLAALRADPRTAALPVAFLTGAVDVDLGEELRGLGAVAVFGKPFDPLTLPGQLAEAFGWVTTREGPSVARRPAG